MSPETEDERPVPRLACLSPETSDELLAGFPGRFAVRACSTPGELDSMLLSGAVDLVVLDCRESVPEAAFLELLRDERVVDFLAVGRPPGRRTLPSWLRSHSCPWPLDRQTFYRLITATARKAAWERAHRRLAERVRGLEDEARLGRKLAGVLHELNNPLDATLRYVRLARERARNEDVQGWLEGAAVGLTRMAAAMEDLHRDARQAAHALRLTDLRELVRQCAVVNGSLDGQLELRTRLPGGPILVPESLRTVLDNLLRNARQAGAKSVEIRVGETSGSRLVIDVADDGEGFGELFKDELFKRGFTTREGEDGTGLGLHHARIAVEQLGGRLEASSPGVGRGAVLTITLPLTDRSRTGEGAGAEEER